MAEEKVKVDLGGNRKGKTTATIVDLLMKALGIHPLQVMGKFPKPPLQIRYICTDFLNGIERVVEPMLLDWCPKKDYLNYRMNDKILLLKNNSFVELMSSQQELDRFYGSSRTIVAVDEQTREDIWNENKKRIIDQGGYMQMSLTPDIKKGLTWEYKELILKSEQDKSIGIYRGITYDNRENLDEASLKKWADGLTELEKRVFIYGDFVPISGLAVDLKPELHIMPPLPVRPQRWIRLRSIDVGGAGHASAPTTCIWAAIEPKANSFIIHIEDEYYGERKTISQHALKIKEKTKFPIYMTFIDPISSKKHSLDTGDTVHLTYLREGIRCVPGLVDVDLGLDNLKKMMLYNENIGSVQLKVHSNCVGVINELKTMSIKDVKDGKAHYISTLRWLCSHRNFLPQKIIGAVY